MSDVRAIVDPDANGGWNVIIEENLAGKWYTARWRGYGHEERRFHRPWRWWAALKARKEVRRLSRERANRCRESFVVSDDTNPDDS